MKLKVSQLIEFLQRAKITTFASDGQRSPSLRPYSKNYTFDDPPFHYEDQYFGEYVDVGQEIVWYQGIPIWGMGYRGGTHAWAYPHHLAIFEFLREALRQPDPVMPIRGPTTLFRDPYFYTCLLSGSLLAFTGSETVYWEGRPAAFRTLVGGLIRGKHNTDMLIEEDDRLRFIGGQEMDDLHEWLKFVPKSEC
jgi:hypothetical protein